jgi:hypothetical protein
VESEIIAFMIDPHGAGTALGLVNSTIATARTLVDLATKAKNHELSTQVSNVLSSVLEMKIKILELDAENRSLRLQLEQKDSVKLNGEFRYFYKDGDPIPLCPKCYEGSGKIAHLSAPKQESGGVRRVCIQGNLSFWERRDTQPQRHSRSWMG